MIHHALWLAIFPPFERDTILVNCFPRLKEGRRVCVYVSIKYALKRDTGRCCCQNDCAGFVRCAAGFGSFQCGPGCLHKNGVTSLQHWSFVICRVCLDFVNEHVGVPSIERRASISLRGGGAPSKVRVIGLSV